MADNSDGTKTTHVQQKKSKSAFSLHNRTISKKISSSTFNTNNINNGYDAGNEHIGGETLQQTLIMDIRESNTPGPMVNMEQLTIPHGVGTPSSSQMILPDNTIPSLNHDSSPSFHQTIEEFNRPSTPSTSRESLQSSSSPGSIDYIEYVGMMHQKDIYQSSNQDIDVDLHDSSSLGFMKYIDHDFDLTQVPQDIKTPASSQHLEHESTQHAANHPVLSQHVIDIEPLTTPNLSNLDTQHSQVLPSTASTLKVPSTSSSIQHFEEFVRVIFPMTDAHLTSSDDVSITSSELDEHEEASTLVYMKLLKSLFFLMYFLSILALTFVVWRMMAP